MTTDPATGPTNPQAQDDLWHEYVAQLRSRLETPFEAQWARFAQIFARRRPEDGPPLAWRPSPERLERANLSQFMRELGLDDYAELHAWSVADRALFWERAVARLGIVLAQRPERWMASSDAEHPQWLAGARLNCVDSCFKAAARKVAIVTGREGTSALDSTTYGELESLVNRVSNGLRALGLREGDGIALYMPMTLECVAAYLGVVKAGCRVISIADSFSAAEVKRRLEIGGARCVVTVSGYVRGGKILDLHDKVCQAEAPRAVVIPGAGEPRLRSGDLVWDDFLGEVDTFDSVLSDPYATTNVLFSSGTTADPKAIPWTHLTAIKCAMDGHFHQDIHDDDVVAWPTNIGWMMGPWLIYATLINDAALALYEGLPSGAGFTGFVRDTGVTVLGTVPSLVRVWRAAGAVPAGSWDGVRTFSSTGEPSNQEDYLWLMSRSGYQAPVIEYCGGTEIGGGYITGTVVQPAAPATFTTAALGLDFVILDEADHPVEEGAEGELFLIPPSIGLSETLLNKNHEEVYYSGCPVGPAGAVLRRHGDQMVRLHKGYFKAHGRADDTMNLGGIKVSSLELERVLDSHPAVYESAAVAVQPGGEGADKLVVFAVVNRQAEAEALSAELDSLLAAELNPLFKIHDLRIREQLPRTASNKLMRRELRREYSKD
ncbi:MAG: AMP-binding protein [Gemmatimonadota bacterium]|nr:MAG: AMP-binding protein [Gemmatimonadota bacterium]